VLNSKYANIVVIKTGDDVADKFQALVTIAHVYKSKPKNVRAASLVYATDETESQEKLRLKKRTSGDDVNVRERSKVHEDW